MDRIWAPWRLAYVEAATPQYAGSSCFICRGLADTDDKSHLLVHRGPLSAVVLNKFPYNNGHLLIAPLAHKGGLSDLSPDEHLDVMQTLSRSVGALDEILRPHGYNIGLNLGAAAGAGLPGHLHWHVVPRWNGDTNFMPVVGDVKVINQSLDAFYDVLAARLR